MISLDSKAQALIEKACKGKSHIKLTVGTFSNGETAIQTFDSTGEISNKNYTYEIGSITKTFTASLLAKYIHEGKMSLDDPISKYVDGLDENAYYPTLKRLATHTAGYHTTLPLSGWENINFTIGALFSGCTNKGVLPFQLDMEKMKQLLQENKLQDKDYPWQYSNFGMALLGYAIGVASGQGYWDTMNGFLSEELGLKHSYTGTCPDRNLRGFNRRNNKDIGNWIWGKDFTAPAGDISSTAEDLLTYARINMCEEQPYLSQCHKKHADISQIFLNRYDMGLGWLLNKTNNNILWHNGGTGAFSSYLSFDKSKQIAWVVLSNYPIAPVRRLHLLHYYLHGGL